MKTSFYFVIWIIIYPILGLLNNQFIDNNSFFVALAIVIGLSWLLHRSMPYTLAYERMSNNVPILEDIYTGNIKSFINRLSTESRLEIIISVYFITTTFVVAYATFKAGAGNWIELIVFGLFTYWAISRAIKLNKALSTVKEDPGVDQCSETASEIYQLNYPAYYEQRVVHSYEEMLPPAPPHFKAFQIFSLIIAGICAILGIIGIVYAAIFMFSHGNFVAGAVAGMYLLYGSLATYFGIKDFATIICALKRNTVGKNYEENI